MAVAIIVIGTTMILSLFILCLVMTFSSKQEPEWARDEKFFMAIQKEQPLPGQGKIKENIDMRNAVAQPYFMTLHQLEVVQVDV